MITCHILCTFNIFIGFDSIHKLSTIILAEYIFLYQKHNKIVNKFIFIGTKCLSQFLDIIKHLAILSIIPTDLVRSILIEMII